MEYLEAFRQALGSWNEVLANLPPLVGALIVLVIGYLIAKLIEVAIRGMLHQTGIDERMARSLGLRDSNTEQAISRFLFLLIMLFVVIGALDVAGMDQVTERLQTLVDPIVSAFPNILAAAVLAFVTWFVATLVKNILQGILNASRLDERLGLDSSRPLSNAIVTVVFFLIILLMLPGILGFLGIPEVTNVLNPLVNSIWTSIPGLVFGGLIIAIGVFIGTIVRRMLSSVLQAVGLDGVPARLGYTGNVNLMGQTLSSIIGIVAMISIIVTMTAEGLRVMNLEFVSGLATLLRNLWAATLIFVIGLFLADLAKRGIGVKNQIFATVAQYLVIFFFGGMALQRAEITPLSSNVVEYLVTGAIVASVMAFGIGGAIAIGLGGRDRVQRYLDKK